LISMRIMLGLHASGRAFSQSGIFFLI